MYQSGFASKHPSAEESNTTHQSYINSVTKLSHPDYFRSVGVNRNRTRRHIRAFYQKECICQAIK